MCFVIHTRVATPFFPEHIRFIANQLKKNVISVIQFGNARGVFLLAFYRRGSSSGGPARVWRPSEQTRALAAFAIRLRTTK